MLRFSISWILLGIFDVSHVKHYLNQDLQSSQHSMLSKVHAAAFGTKQHRWHPLRFLMQNRLSQIASYLQRVPQHGKCDQPQIHRLQQFVDTPTWQVYLRGRSGKGLPNSSKP